MRIHFKRSGGLSPAMNRQCMVDSATLPPEKARELQQLVEGADIFQLPTRGEAPRSAADTFHYTLKIEHEGKEHSVQLDQTAVPSKAWPLLNWLTKEGRPPGRTGTQAGTSSGS